MHGGLDQPQRTFLFNQFRHKKIKLMIATDVAARGLDFTHVSHVINYDTPPSHDTYTHRTGRTGRMGRDGIAMTLVTDQDLKVLEKLLQLNRIEPVWRGPAPVLTPGAKRRREAKKPQFTGRSTGRHRRRKAVPVPA